MDWFRDDRPLDTARGRCSSCHNFARACIAHFLLLKEQRNNAQKSVVIPLHSDYAALRKSARDGCHLCRCWHFALIGGCESPLKLQRLQECRAPIYATSPVTQIQSTMRSGVAQIIETHYFEVCSDVLTAQMRLGGVSMKEFTALMQPRGKNEATWALERLKLCLKDHAICSELRVSNALPTRLLKLGQEKSEPIQLVDGSTLEGNSYVALSYCWGGDHKMMLTKDTEAVLRTGVAIDNFSLTIQHALEVCRQLGVFHLWVDALCIVQGHNSDDWNKEAASIQNTYGNALMTLSAVSADSASDGLMDSMVQDNYSLEPLKCDIDLNLPYPARKGLAEIRADSPCASRGWIFQEELLSRRILYWSHHGLFWSCAEHTAAQNGTADDGKDGLFSNITIPDILDPHQFRTSRDPLLLWDEMISYYSMRDFRYHSDRLPAVSGLASIISQSTGEGYLHGFWVSRLPAQLLWAVKSPWRPLELGEGKPPPTWSWASIAPVRKIEMPKQASARARLLEISPEAEGGHTILHLSGRLRPLIEGLQRLGAWPAEKETAAFGLELPGLENDPNRWAVHEEKRCVLVSLFWKRPILIFLDQELPESYDDLVCFEISYLGFLLLRPLTNGKGKRIPNEPESPPTSAHLPSSHTSSLEEGMYERVGCAPWHREAGFFAAAPFATVKLV